MKKILFLFSILFFLFEPSGYSQSEILERGRIVSFEEVLDQALKTDSGVLRAKDRIEKEEALKKSVFRGFFPKVKTEVYGAATSESGNQRILYWTTELRLPLFEGGRRIHELRKGDLRIEEEKLHLREIKENLRQEIKFLYLGVLKEKELLGLSTHWLKETKAYLEISKKLMTSRLLTEEELLKAQSLFQTARLEHVKHKEALDYGEELLRDILELKGNEKFEFDPLDQTENSTFTNIQFMDEMKKKSELYEIWNLKLKEKKEERGILVSERFPKLSLTGRFNVTQDEGFRHNRFEAGILGSWNIWDFGVLGSQIKAKEAEIKETEALGKEKLRKLEYKVRKVFHELKVAREKIKLSRTFLKEKKKHHQNEKMRLIVEDKGKFGILDSFIDLTRAQMALLKSLSEYEGLQVALERMRGGNILS